AEPTPETIRPAVWLLRGRALAALGRTDEAEAALELALAAAERRGQPPLRWRVQAALGRLWAAQGRRDEAERAFQDARATVDPIASGLPDRPSPELDGDAPCDHFRRAAALLLPGPRRPTARQLAREGGGRPAARARQQGR